MKRIVLLPDAMETVRQFEHLLRCTDCVVIRSTPSLFNSLSAESQEGLEWLTCNPDFVTLQKSGYRMDVSGRVTYQSYTAFHKYEQFRIVWCYQMICI
jgi:hypothetical protein